MAVDEARRIGIRWTVGDVSEHGFEALQLSIWGAWHAFGPKAAYAVCVNTVPVEAARERTGCVPDAIAWHEAPRQASGELAAVLGENMAEGMGWKLAPLHVFPDRWEIALDNDCILWSPPPALRDWLAIPPAFGQCLLAEDVARCYGQFAAQAPHAPFNAGIRGLPPGFDRPADDCMAEHWARHLPELRQRTGAPAREDVLAA